MSESREKQSFQVEKMRRKKRKREELMESGNITTRYTRLEVFFVLNFE